MSHLLKLVSSSTIPLFICCLVLGGCNDEKTRDQTRWDSKCPVESGLTAGAWSELVLGGDTLGIAVDHYSESNGVARVVVSEDLTFADESFRQEQTETYACDDDGAWLTERLTRVEYDALGYAFWSEATFDNFLFMPKKLKVGDTWSSSSKGYGRNYLNTDWVPSDPVTAVSTVVEQLSVSVVDVDTSALKVLRSAPSHEDIDEYFVEKLGVVKTGDWEMAEHN